MFCSAALRTQYEISACLLMLKHIRFAEEGTYVLFLLQFLLKLNSKATGPGWKEWIRIKKRKRVGKTKGGENAENSNNSYYDYNNQSCR